MANTWLVNSNAEMDDWEKLVIYRDGKPVFQAFGHQCQKYGHFIETLTGWWGSPGASRQYALERPFGGLTTTPTVCGARTITITGWSYCESDVHAIRVARQLPGDIFLADGQTHTYAMETYGFETTLWAPIELDGSFICDPVTYQREVTWQIPLRTLSPYVYGPLQSIQVIPQAATYGLQFPLFEPGYLDWGDYITNTGELINEGNQPAWPTVTLMGNSPAGCHIDDGWGNRVTYRGPIGKSGVMLDFESGQVITASGSESMEYVTRRDWWSIPPGALRRPRIVPIQEDTIVYAKIDFRPAYL